MQLTAQPTVIGLCSIQILMAIRSLAFNPDAENTLVTELTLLSQQPAPDMNRAIDLIKSFLSKDESNALRLAASSIRCKFFSEG